MSNGADLDKPDGCGYSPRHMCSLYSTDLPPQPCHGPPQNIAVTSTTSSNFTEAQPLQHGCSADFMANGILEFDESVDATTFMRDVVRLNRPAIIRGMDGLLTRYGSSHSWCRVGAAAKFLHSANWTAQALVQAAGSSPLEASPVPYATEFGAEDCPVDTDLAG